MYKTTINNKQSKSYTVWKDIKVRCNQTRKDYYITYKDCTICEEWLNYQNFAKWFNENYIEGYHLDKDLLIQNNKHYSPETCCFIPKELNNLFRLDFNRKTNLPKGVYKNNNKFQVIITNNNKTKSFGTYNTIEEASQIAHSKRIENIKSIINNSDFKLTEKVYYRIQEIIKD